MDLNFSSVWQYWPFLYNGALLTLKMTAICAVLGFALGVLLSLIKLSKFRPLVWFGQFYTSIFRGTPLLVQLCIVHFGLPQMCIRDRSWMTPPGARWPHMVWPVKS